MPPSSFLQPRPSTISASFFLEQVRPNNDVGNVALLISGIYAIVPFPDGYGATVHLFWPGKGFQLLGACADLISFRLQT